MSRRNHSPPRGGRNWQPPTIKPDPVYHDHSIDYLNNDESYLEFSLSSDNEFLLNEMVMNILDYFDGIFVMRVCGLVSRQFRYCVGKVPLREMSSKHFGSYKSCVGNRFSKQYLDLEVKDTGVLPLYLIQDLNCENLKRLTIRNQYFPYDRIGTMQVFKNLEELKIDVGVYINEPELMTMFEKDMISNLKVLDVSGCFNLDLSSVFNNENSKAAKLEKLIADQTRVSLPFILNWKYATQLTHLSVNDCSFTEEDFELLVTSNSSLCNLTHLNIQKSFKQAIDNMKEVQLSETLNFTKLKTMKMGWNMFSPFAISPRVKFQNMITLDMSGLRIGEKAFKSVIRNQSLKNLENLIVRECRLGWEFIEALVNPTINCLKSLKTLNMNDNKISNKGIILLSNSKILSQLTIIEFDINYIGLEGATAFLENYEKFKHLKYISLKNNNFGKKLIEFKEIPNAIVDEN